MQWDSQLYCWYVVDNVTLILTLVWRWMNMAELFKRVIIIIGCYEDLLHCLPEICEGNNEVMSLSSKYYRYWIIVQGHCKKTKKKSGTDKRLLSGQHFNTDAETLDAIT